MGTTGPSHGFWKTGVEGEAQVAQLKELVLENLSFSQIANIMGAPSRNVVLCKFNRLREKDKSLSHPSAPSNQVRVYRPDVPRLEKPRPLPAPPISAQELVPMRTEAGELIDIFNVTPRHCQYPYGDPLDRAFHYCGHPIKEGSHYCEPHHAKCYQPKVAYKRPYQAGRHV